MTEPEGYASSIHAEAALIGGFYLVMALPQILAGSGMAPATIAATALLGLGLAALSAIDLRTFRLPDAITLPLIALGFGFTWLLDWQPALPWRIAAAAGGYAFIWCVNEAYRALRGRAGMGMGDAKLLAAAGAWLGFEGLPSTMLSACVGALLFVAGCQAAGRPVGFKEPLPFGPFLAAGLWLVWLYGPLV